MVPKNDPFWHSRLRMSSLNLKGYLGAHNHLSYCTYKSPTIPTVQLASTVNAKCPYTFYLKTFKRKTWPHITQVQRHTKKNQKLFKLNFGFNSLKLSFPWKPYFNFIWCGLYKWQVALIMIPPYIPIYFYHSTLVMESTEREKWDKCTVKYFCDGLWYWVI
jgi:hypothetical protein